jgi:hypothetical protein
MMDWLSNLLPYPWSLLAAIALPIVLHRLGVKIPFMNPSPAPAPTPATPNPSPANPSGPILIPTVTDRPILNGLLSLLATLRNLKAEDLDPTEKIVAVKLLEELKVK